jgi:DNA-binding CsgD family transcriptional regulator
LKTISAAARKSAARPKRTRLSWRGCRKSFIGWTQDSARHKLSLEQVAARTDAVAWEKRFELTPAETRLAAHLLNGGTPATYVAKQNLSPHTVRNHLRSIYAKTNTNRQVALLQLLLRASGKNP